MMNASTQFMLLETRLKPALVKDISVYLEGNGQTFQDFIKDGTAHLQTLLPEPLLRNYYTGNTLDDFDLLSLINLIVLYPHLAAYFRGNKCAYLCEIKDVLFELYRLLRSDGGVTTLTENDETESTESTMAIDSTEKGGLEWSEAVIRRTLPQFGVMVLESAEAREQTVNGLPGVEESACETGSTLEGLIDNELFELVYLKQLSIPQKSDIDRIRNIKEKDMASGRQETFEQLRTLITETLLKFLRCDVCTKRFGDDFQTLPCLHTLCVECAKLCLSNVSDAGKVACPKCHRIIWVSEADGADNLLSFPGHLLLARIYELCRKLSPPSGTSNEKEVDLLECFVCVKLARCVEIHSGRLYCDFHRAPVFHSSINPSNKVKFMTAAEFLNVEVVADQLEKLCPRHCMKLKYFCCQCQVFCCKLNNCRNRHSAHGGTQDAQILYHTQQQNIKRLAPLVSLKAEKARAVLESSGKNQLDVAAVQDDVRRSLDRYFDQMETTLREKRRICYQRLDTAAEQCWHHDQSIRTSLRTILTQVEEIEAKSAELTKDGMNELEALGVYAKQQQLTNAVTIVDQLKTVLVHNVDDQDPLLFDRLTISYPETELQKLALSITNIDVPINTHSLSASWAVVLAVANGSFASGGGAARNFLVDGKRIFVAQSHYMSGMGGSSRKIVTTTLDQLSKTSNFCASNALPGVYLLTNVYAMATSRSGDLLAFRDIKTELVMPNMTMKHTAHINKYHVTETATNRLAECMSQTVVDGHLRTFENCMLKTTYSEGNNRLNDDDDEPAVMFLADSRVILKMKEDGTLLRKYDFRAQVEISDFAPIVDRDLIAIVETSRRLLFIFDCHNESSIAIPLESKREKIVNPAANAGVLGKQPSALHSAISRLPLFSSMRMEQTPLDPTDVFGWVPLAVTADSFGHILVADSGTCSVQIFSLNGKLLKSLPYPDSIVNSIKTQILMTEPWLSVQAVDGYVYLFDSSCFLIFRRQYLP